MKPWQQGFELEDLKKMAAPFRASNAKHVYSAFGLVRERDVAAALSRGRFMSNLGAAAIVRPLRHGQTVNLFGTLSQRLPAGTIMIDDVGYYSLGALSSLLDSIRDQSDGAARLAADVFQEDRGLVATLKKKGLSYVGSKIMAGSEIKALYLDNAIAFKLPELEQMVLKEVRPGFATESEVDYIAREIAAYGATKPWAQHYSSYNKRHSWTAFALRGYVADDPGFIIKPAEMSRRWKEDHHELLQAVPAFTPAAEHFPVALRVAGRIPGQKDRIRFMRLAVEGELTRHADITDREAGVSPGMVVRLHIPIRTRPGVEFRAWRLNGQMETQQLKEGGLYYLDQRKPHAVVNASGRDRVHLVVDARCDYELISWLAA